jgi:hypothetical protein
MTFKMCSLITLQDVRITEDRKKEVSFCNIRKRSGKKAKKESNKLKMGVQSKTQLCMFKGCIFLKYQKKQHVSAIHGHHQVLSST